MAPALCAAAALLPLGARRVGGAAAPPALRSSPSSGLQTIVLRPAASRPCGPRHKLAETVVETEEKYCWTKQWYPVAPVWTLDPSRPHPTELLGQRLVLWCDGNGDWQCFQDRCPHRLAPLSEGRLEDGRLMCSYHGWEFDGSGSCTRIPQSDSPKAEETACSSRRSCATRHPSQIRHGLLFVWGEGGAAAALEAAATEVTCAVRELDDKERAGEYSFISNWYTGTVPYGYDTLVENVVDPSHVHFSHHGLQGSRDKAGPDRMKVVEGPSVTKGFTIQGQLNDSFALSPPGERDIIFQPPSLLQYRRGGISPEGLTKFSMIVYAVPVRPGTSRIFFATITSLKSPLFKLLALKPTFLDHITRMSVLSGDNVFLHAQERELRRTGPADTFAQQFYMPASSDLAVNVFRKWFHEMAGNGIPYAEGVPRDLPPLETDRTKLLDRWEQHTRDCPACRAAHDRLGAAQVALAALGAALFLGLSASLGGGAGSATISLFGGFTLLASSARNALLGAGILLCALAARKAKDLQQKLVFEDYVHAHK